MSRNRTGTVRTGVHVNAAPSGCRCCGHPFTLHSNGETGCKAAGCTAGPPVSCPECDGTTIALAGSGPCGTCHGEGTVPGPCAGFAREPAARELLAS